MIKTDWRNATAAHKDASSPGNSVMFCLAVAFASVWASPGASWAQRSQGAASGTVVYQPGDLHVESSRVFIHVYKKGLGHEHAVIGKLRQGNLKLEAGEGLLVVDMRSFSADTEQARKYLGLAGTTDANTRQQVDANMLGPAVLDVKTFPTATFQATKIIKLASASRRGLPQYELRGDFSLHGATAPVRIISEAEERGNWLHLRGRFAIRQTDYGITPFSKAFGAIGVADRLDIYGDLWFARQRLVADSSRGDLQKR